MDLIKFAEEIIKLKNENDKFKNGIQEIIKNLERNIKDASENQFSREHLVLSGIQVILKDLIK
jgi:hypothetical protein